MLFKLLRFPVIQQYPIMTKLVADSENSSENNDSNSNNVFIAVIMLLSTVTATANTLLYKAMLNSFSSPHANYGFFAGQFSMMLYVFQAAAVSCFIGFKDITSLNEIFTTPHIIYIIMGLLDAACGTLAAISGAHCPGELQTILNQTIIPMTLIGTAFFLGSTFKGFQIGGSLLITFGAIVASSSFFFTMPTNIETFGATTATTASVITYFSSILPSAASNIYKEGKMKERDMHELHTSTVVSFWQFGFGFLFLPLLFLPALGGMKVSETSSQITDGFACFMGHNPKDPHDSSCENAFAYTMGYIFINFVYNVLLLIITKRGSAVLLVISQALALPVTNIAFSLRIFMGDDAEPLSVLDLVGLLLVCIGFLTYSGFGFASNFIFASGAPGQMTYIHIEDVDQVIISSKMAEQPEQLSKFLVGSLLHQAVVRSDRLEAHAHVQKGKGFSCVGDNTLSEEPLLNKQNNSTYGATSNESHIDDTVELTEMGQGRSAMKALYDANNKRALDVAREEATPLAASKKALEIARDTVRILEKQVAVLALHQHQNNNDNNTTIVHKSQIAHLSTPEILRQYQEMSPRVNDIEYRKSLRASQSAANSTTLAPSSATARSQLSQQRRSLTKNGIADDSAIK